LYQTIYVATSCIGSKRLYAYAVANFMHMILATHSNVDIVHMVVATYADPVQYRFWINVTILITCSFFLSFSQLSSDCGLLTLKAIQFAVQFLATHFLIFMLLVLLMSIFIHFPVPKYTMSDFSHSRIVAGDKTSK